MTHSDTRPRSIEERGATIVYTPHGSVAHVLREPYRSEDVSLALCGRWSWSRSEWRGLGSHEERERGRRLPLCSQCLSEMIASDLFGWRDGYMPGVICEQEHPATTVYGRRFEVGTETRHADGSECRWDGAKWLILQPNENAAKERFRAGLRVERSGR